VIEAVIAVEAHSQRLLFSVPLSSCYLGKATRRGFVLGYGGASVSGIVDGVRRLCKMISKT